MFEELKKVINDSGVDIPEIHGVSRAIDTLESNVSKAKTALAGRIMQMVQAGDVEQLYKLRSLVSVFNAGESQSNSVTLASNLTNYRPKSVNFNGKSEDVSTWRGVSEFVLKNLYSENIKNFTALLHSADIDKEKPYFAKASDNMTAPLQLGHGKDVVYADVSRVTNNDFFILKKTLNSLNHTADEVVIELDPDYSRKKVEKRASSKKKDAKSEKTTEKKKPGRPKKVQEPAAAAK